MALISEVVTELSVMSRIPEKSVALIGRYLREAGLLSQKGRGRGAAHARSLDAARLCIALMVGGKARDAPEAVIDFGRLVCDRAFVEPDHQYSDFNLEAVCDLGIGHRFEDALACLIEIWSNEELVREMDARRGEMGFWPAMGARIFNSLLAAEIRFGVSKYTYTHPSLLEPRHEMDMADIDAFIAAGQANQKIDERYLSVSEKYFSGIRSTREISVVEIMPLGEVVAGHRQAGFRESDEALTAQRLERERKRSHP